MGSYPHPNLGVTLSLIGSYPNPYSEVTLIWIGSFEDRPLSSLFDRPRILRPSTFTFFILPTQFWGPSTFIPFWPPRIFRPSTFIPFWPPTSSFIFCGPSTFLFWTAHFISFWTVHLNPGPSTFGALDRPLSPSWTVHFPPRLSTFTSTQIFIGSEPEIHRFLQPIAVGTESSCG